MITKEVVNPKFSVYQKEPDFWDRYIFPIGLPILLVIVFGLLQGYLITSKEWFFVFVVPFLVPIGVLVLRYPFVTIITWMMILPFFPPNEDVRYLYWIFHRAMIPGTLGLLILSQMLKIKSYPKVPFNPIFYKLRYRNNILIKFRI